MGTLTGLFDASENRIPPGCAITIIPAIELFGKGCGGRFDGTRVIESMSPNLNVDHGFLINVPCGIVILTPGAVGEITVIVCKTCPVVGLKLEAVSGVPLAVSSGTSQIGAGNVFSSALIFAGIGKIGQLPGAVVVRASRNTICGPKGGKLKVNIPAALVVT